MNFKILKDNTEKIVCRSNVRLGDNSLVSNLLVDSVTTPVIIKSRHETFEDDDTISTATSAIPDDDSYQGVSSIPIIETSDLVGRFFFINTSEDSQSLRLNAFQVLDSRQDDLNYDPTLKEFVVTSKDNAIEEILR